MSMIDRCEFLHNLPCEQVSDRIAELEEENAKLHDVESENASLRGAVQGLGELCDKYKAENAELRELAYAVKEFVEDTHCEDCPCRRDCDDNNRIFCVNDFSYHAFAAMRELGIEVKDD